VLRAIGLHKSSVDDAGEACVTEESTGNHVIEASKCDGWFVTNCTSVRGGLKVCVKRPLHDLGCEPEAFEGLRYNPGLAVVDVIVADQ
jgi:hypothetical protein